MPIIPMPIFIPGDDGKELIIPGFVEALLFGGIITLLVGLVAVMVAVVIELVFDSDADVLFKVAVILALGGGCVAIIGLILALITAQTVEG